MNGMANGRVPHGAFRVESAQPYDPHEELRRDLDHIRRNAGAFIKHIRRMREVSYDVLKNGDPAVLGRAQGRVAVLDELIAMIESRQG